jgi:hypothetical protein
MRASTKMMAIQSISPKRRVALTLSSIGRNPRECERSSG